MEAEEKLPEVKKEETVTQKLKEAKDLLALKVKALQEKNKVLLAKVKDQSVKLKAYSLEIKAKGSGLVDKVLGIFPAKKVYRTQLVNGDILLGPVKPYSPVMVTISTDEGEFLVPVAKILISKKI